MASTCNRWPKWSERDRISETGGTASRRRRPIYISFIVNVKMEFKFSRHDRHAWPRGQASVPRAIRIAMSAARQRRPNCFALNWKTCAPKLSAVCPRMPESSWPSRPWHARWRSPVAPGIRLSTKSRQTLSRLLHLRRGALNGEFAGPAAPCSYRNPHPIVSFGDPIATLWIQTHGRG